MSRTLFKVARVFDGDDFSSGCGVVVVDGIIESLTPDTMAVDDVDTTVTLTGGILAPGFIDVQVNGGGGVMFNETPTAEAVATIVDTHQRRGTTALLPTLISDRPEVARAGLEAVREAIDAGVHGCAGIHLEGPWLAPSRAGAHPTNFLRPMSEGDIIDLLDCGLETVLLTVAPEIVSPDIIRRLTAGGVIVSLGHSAATCDEVAAAVNAGARGVTHLFNAMSPLDHRAPGMVGAALDHADLWCGIIADGHHVHPLALRIALRAKRPPGRLFLVSDATATVGHDQDCFDLLGRSVSRSGGRLTLPDGILAGADLDMARSLQFAVDKLEVPFGEALRMASLYPAMFLCQDHWRGRIKPGYAADFIHISDEMEVLSAWLAGRKFIDS